MLSHIFKVKCYVYKIVTPDDMFKTSGAFLTYPVCDGNKHGSLIFVNS